MSKSIDPTEITSASIERQTRLLIIRIQTWAAPFPRAKSQIADAAGLAPNILARFESPQWTSTLHTLRRQEMLIDGGWAPLPSTSSKSQSNEILIA